MNQKNDFFGWVYESYDIVYRFYIYNYNIYIYIYINGVFCCGCRVCYTLSTIDMASVVGTSATPSDVVRLVFTHARTPLGRRRHILTSLSLIENLRTYFLDIPTKIIASFGGQERSGRVCAFESFRVLVRRIG